MAIEATFTFLSVFIFRDHVKSPSVGLKACDYATEMAFVDDSRLDKMSRLG